MGTDNHSLPASPPAVLDTRRWIELEKLRLTFANLPVALTLSFFVSFFLVAVLRNVQSSAYLVAWFLVAALITLIRHLHSRQFKFLREQEIDVRHWRLRVDIGTTLSGVWWGCGTIVLFPADLPHQMYI